MDLMDKSDSPSFTFVIPCFNEEENLPSLLDSVNRYVASEKDCRFILVDNGSTDATWALLQDVPESAYLSKLRLTENQGYGGGIWAGVILSNSQWTGWFHADMQVTFEDVLTAKESTKKSKHSTKGVRRGRPISDRILTAGMSIYCSVLFLTFLRDINGQPTIYETTFLQKISSPPTDFSLDLHCYVTAQKSGYSLHRQQVIMKKRLGGKSSWNTGWLSRVTLVKRTAKYAWSLRMSNHND